MKCFMPPTRHVGRLRALLCTVRRKIRWHQCSARARFHDFTGGWHLAGTKHGAIADALMGSFIVEIHLEFRQR